MEYLNTKTNEFYSFSELKVKFDDLRVANFTNNFTVKDWNPDFAQIIHTQMPCAGNHEKVIRDGNTLKEGVYYQKWKLVEMTNEEKKEADKLAEIHQRQARDSLLYDSDWSQLPDCPLTKEKVIEFREYRKYLRDLPTKTGWPYTHQIPGTPIISEV